jgi:hypothetical protein
VLTLSLLDPTVLIKGGPGSGNHGHAGRPGEVGGSAPKGASVAHAAADAVTDAVAGGNDKPTRKGGTLYERHGAKQTISGQYKVEDKDLYWGGTTIMFEGDDHVVIGGGISYYPRKSEGASASGAVDFDGLITVGPADWVGKKAKDIPELVAEIDRQVAELPNWKGGDFGKVQPSEYKDRISGLLQSYKSPLTYDDTQVRVSLMARAYLEKGRVEAKLSTEFIDKELADQAMVLSQLEQFPQAAEWLKPMADQYPDKIFEAKVRTLKFAQSAQSLMDQEGVNQFAAEVARTQADLAERYGESITLYRGVTGDYANALKKATKGGKPVDLDVYNISSWTSDETIARGFAKGGGVVIRQQVPVSDIFFSHHTSPYIRTDDYLFGGEEEYEFLVANREGRMRVTKEDLL